MGREEVKIINCTQRYTVFYDRLHSCLQTSGNQRYYGKLRGGGKAKLYANNVIVLVQVKTSLEITHEWRDACWHADMSVPVELKKHSALISLPNMCHTQINYTLVTHPWFVFLFIRYTLNVIWLNTKYCLKMQDVFSSNFLGIYLLTLDLTLDLMFGRKHKDIIIEVYLNNHILQMRKIQIE